jgi:hypothetical protein
MPKRTRFSFTLADVTLGGSIDKDGNVTIQRSGYVIRNRDGRASIQCLTCGLTSHNPNDVEQKYCGHCHKFHEG